MLADLLDPPDADEDDAPPPVPRQRRCAHRMRTPLLAGGAVGLFAARLAAPDAVDPLLETATAVAGLYAAVSAAWDDDEEN